MTEPEQTKFLGPVPEVLFVAILTAGAYWLAFLYEAGYLRGFGLPAHLVEVSVQTTLSVALAVSGLIWFLFSIINFVLMLWPKHPAIQEKAFRVGVVLLILFWHLIIYGLRVQDWILYVFWIVFIGIFEFLWPLLVYHDKPTLRERFIADEIAESRVRARGVASRIFAAFGPAAYGLLVLFVLGGTLAYTAGRAKATTQKEFFVFAEAPNTAVIRIYGDMILAAPFDKETKTLQAKVVIRKIGIDNVNLILDTDAGPLAQQKGAVSVMTQGPTNDANYKMQPTAKGGG